MGPDRCRNNGTADLADRREPKAEIENVLDADAAFRLGADPVVIAQMAERAAARATQPADWTRVATFMVAATKDLTHAIGEGRHLAIACVKAGDRAGYRAACAALAKHSAPAVSQAPTTAIRPVLVPMIIPPSKRFCGSQFCFATSRAIRARFL